MYSEIIEAVKIITYIVEMNCFLVAMYLVCGITDFFFALFKPDWKSPFGLHSRKKGKEDED